MVSPRNQTRRKSSAFLGPRSRKRVTVTNQDPKKLMPPPRFPGMEPPRWLAFKAKARALGYIVNEHEGRITDTHRLTKDRNGQIRASADADISLRELKNVVDGALSGKSADELAKKAAEDAQKKAAAEAKKKVV